MDPLRAARIWRRAGSGGGGVRRHSAARRRGHPLDRVRDGMAAAQRAQRALPGGRGSAVDDHSASSRHDAREPDPAARCTGGKAEVMMILALISAAAQLVAPPPRTWPIRE